MDKQGILSEVSTFIFMNDYTPADITITHGGALVMLGLRRATEDIDMNVSPEIWKREISKLPPGHVTRMLIDGSVIVDISPSMSIRTNWEKLVVVPNDNHTHQDGWMYQGTKELLREYLLLNRLKDEASIRALKARINLFN